MPSKLLIKRPLLAATLEDITTLRFPLLATPKLDGIRALKLDGEMKSRTLKAIRNGTMNSILSSLLPDGSDGEIMSVGSFQNTTSDVMTSYGKADYKKEFTYYWFDLFTDPLAPNKPYTERIEEMKRYIDVHPGMLDHPQGKIIPLLPHTVHSQDELDDFEAKCLAEGYEGVILRKPTGIYKNGRSTVKEAHLLKLKRFKDSEARILRFEEQMGNNNETFLDELGYNKRSNHKEGLVGKGILGSFIVQDIHSNVEFRIGTGLTAAQREKFWEKKNELLGKIVKYKYFDYEILDKPRHPVFLGFRDLEDI